MDQQERQAAQQSEAELQRPLEAIEDLSPDEEDCEQVNGGFLVFNFKQVAVKTVS
jgi:hypothetical protein